MDLCSQGYQKTSLFCINCDESEPGTFKDREIVTWDPHLLIEGIVIAAYALNSHQSYIYFRGEYTYESEIFRKAVEEAYRKKLSRQKYSRHWI
jgi:NADH-quinone oxidoreductase subunit F